MTCIIGYKGSDGSVFIGGDSDGTDAWFNQTVRADPKVFRVGEFLIGFTDSFRMGQLLMFNLKPPAIKHKDVYKYMVTEFVEEVRRCFKEGGFNRNKEGRDIGGDFLVAVRGRLFRVESDFQVGESNDNYIAAGSGESFAMGVLFAKENSKEAPRKQIKKALEAASHFNAAVCSPYLIKRLPPYVFKKNAKVVKKKISKQK